MKPILFSTAMVQAIMGGTKTQTRRVIKPQPTGEMIKGRYSYQPNVWVDNAFTKYRPRYLPGDVLYVREAWRSVDFEYCDGKWSASIEYKDGQRGPRVSWYDNSDVGIPDNCIYSKTGWQPSIHMPREAARLFLRVTDVRAERVQDISVEDVIAEGVEADNEISNSDIATHESIRNWNWGYAQFLYGKLWDSLNAKRGYGMVTNPWVWVYTFEWIEKSEVKDGDQ